MAFLDKVEGTEKRFLFYCPGCKCSHYINDSWEIKGENESLTVQPSILVNGFKADSNEVRCHLYIKEGKIEFLSDCNHELAGKTVPMEHTSEEERKQEQITK